MSKLKFAFYWAASCGGCEMAILELHEKILDVAAAADIVFWPAAIDVKYKDVEAFPDKHIDVCLYNGAVRTQENEHLAHLLRSKSKILVAYGSCSHLGGIPALANVTNRQGVFECAYKYTASTDNSDNVMPKTSVKVNEGTLTLPEFYDTVKTLAQTVDVDYFVPGCPPVPEQTWAVIEHIVQGKPLPPKGTVLGATQKTVCDECKREKEEKKITKFYRPFEIIPEPKKCLLEQGIICAGPATRGGCDARCINANMPCRGCYGPPEGVVDQGAKFLSAIASVIDAKEPAEIDKIINQIADPLGTFYRFSLAHSLMRRTRLKEVTEPAQAVQREAAPARK
jgi:F420-non-reducing hydrogenase small subunit